MRLAYSVPNKISKLRTAQLLNFVSLNGIFSVLSIYLSHCVSLSEYPASCTFISSMNSISALSISIVFGGHLPDFINQSLLSDLIICSHQTYTLLRPCFDRLCCRFHWQITCVPCFVFRPTVCISTFVHNFISLHSRFLVFLAARENSVQLFPAHV